METRGPDPADELGVGMIRIRVISKRRRRFQKRIYKRMFGNWWRWRYFLWLINVFNSRSCFRQVSADGVITDDVSDLDAYDWVDSLD